MSIPKTFRFAHMYYFIMKKESSTEYPNRLLSHGPFLIHPHSETIPLDQDLNASCSALWGEASTHP